MKGPRGHRRLGCPRRPRLHPRRSLRNRRLPQSAPATTSATDRSTGAATAIAAMRDIVEQGDVAHRHIGARGNEGTAETTTAAGAIAARAALRVTWLIVRLLIATVPEKTKRPLVPGPVLLAPESAKLLPLIVRFWGDRRQVAYGRDVGGESNRVPGGRVGERGAQAGVAVHHEIRGKRRGRGKKRQHRDRKPIAVAHAGPWITAAARSGPAGIASEAPAQTTYMHPSSVSFLSLFFASSERKKPF